jgi:hypothetical protein
LPVNLRGVAHVAILPAARLCCCDVVQQHPHMQACLL